MKVYAVLHNPMYMESAAQTISLHKTAEGAYKKFRKLIVDAYNEEREDHLLRGRSITPYWKGKKYNRFEWFGIKKKYIED